MVKPKATDCIIGDELRESFLCDTLASGGISRYISYSVKWQNLYEINLKNVLLMTER